MATERCGVLGWGLLRILVRRLHGIHLDERHDGAEDFYGICVEILGLELDRVPAQPVLFVDAYEDAEVELAIVPREVVAAEIVRPRKALVEHFEEEESSSQFVSLTHSGQNSAPAGLG